MTPKIIIFAALLSAGTGVAVFNAGPVKAFDGNQGLVPKPEPVTMATFRPVFASYDVDPCFRSPPPIVQSPDCLSKFEKKWGRKAASSEVDTIAVPAPKLISSGEEDQPDYFTRRVLVMDQFGGSKQNY